MKTQTSATPVEKERVDRDMLFDLFDFLDLIIPSANGEDKKIAAEKKRLAEEARREKAIAEGKWICQCGYINEKHLSECPSCGKWKPSPPPMRKKTVQEAPEENIAQTAEPVQTAESAADTTEAVSVKGIWFCDKCGSCNENTAVCKDCGNKKE